MSSETNTSDCFLSFKTDISGIALPEKFTFPFYYQPHQLAEIACKEIQELIKQKEWAHDFGVQNATSTSVGKMFGVLVVQNTQGEIGYVAGFSGKIGDDSTVHPFVPPVYDRLTTNSYYKQEEDVLNGYNAKFEELTNSKEFAIAKEKLAVEKQEFETVIAGLKSEYKAAKKERRKLKEAAKLNATPEEYEKLQEKHREESLAQQHNIKKENYYRTESLNVTQEIVDRFQNEIDAIKTKRREKSGILQKWLFDQYQFLNKSNTPKNLWDIFKVDLNIPPPSGAGDCAAPKMIQYAFANGFKPIAMAEFWWGTSPSSAIRKHLHFYPACKSKCEPILGHMLEGTELDENLLLKNPAEGKELKIAYEDDDLVIVNKPSEFLSVPGKTITDCVYSRMKERYPDATGPLLVHRLDMSTSGILLVAKTKEIHKELQKQFIERTVKKRYTALLDGELKEDHGFVELPLRVDLDNRPCQLVCYEYGKSARTKWVVSERKDGKTKVFFYPITGRTHQLRVHAAHEKGLNTPIVGDDLYGTKSSRLHLHAEFLEFIHPRTGKKFKIHVKAEF